MLSGILDGVFDVLASVRSEPADGYRARRRDAKQRERLFIETQLGLAEEGKLSDPPPEKLPGTLF